MRSVIFGVDGLTFRVLHPLMERGGLPNFRKLQQEGCEAVLESKYPPLTPPAWTSLSTGLRPARHGMYDYWSYADEQEHGVTRSIHVQTRRRGGKAIWNILSEYGKQVLVINVPATYPPETINGMMISGYMTPPNMNVAFTYPTSFKEELFRIAPSYSLIPGPVFEKHKLKMQVKPMVDVILRMTEQRTKLIIHLLKEHDWDLCYLAYIGPDRIQHPLWEETFALDPRTNEYFYMLDHALGLVLEQLGPDDTLFVVSDHGFHGHNSYFDINEYLCRKGLLTLGPSQDKRRKASKASTVRHVVTKLGMRQVARKVKRYLKASGAWHEPAVDGSRPQLEDVDWDKTLAYVPSFSGFQGGYADIFLSPEITDEQIAGLCEDLRRQRDPKNGNSLIDEIFTTEVYGKGPYEPREPHLLLLPNDGVTFRMDSGNERVWEDIGKTFGSHQKDGVLYAYGGPFKRGFKAPNAEVFDLVPTLLKAMDLPFPYEFDGRVLDELFVGEQQAKQVSTVADDGVEGGLARGKLKKLLEV